MNAGKKKTIEGVASAAPYAIVPMVAALVGGGWLRVLGVVALAVLFLAAETFAQLGQRLIERQRELIDTDTRLLEKAAKQIDVLNEYINRLHRRVATELDKTTDTRGA